MKEPTHSYLLPDEQRFEYSCLIDSLKPYVKASGMSTLNQHPNAMLYNQVNLRLRLLAEIGCHIKQMEKERDSLVSSTRTFDSQDRAVYDTKLHNYEIAIHKYGPSDAPRPSLPVALYPALLSALRMASTASVSDLKAAHSHELAFVTSVQHQLDMYNTIDHRPMGDAKFVQQHGTADVTKVWREYITCSPEKELRDLYLCPKIPGVKDEVTELMERMTLSSRRSFSLQRIMQALSNAHDAGWFIVFDTLTLADDRIKVFYENKTALRDHFRDIGRLVLQAEGRSTKGSSSDCFQYFAVPEYGTKEGRLHFHAVYLMRTLPLDSVDPNLNARVRNRRQLDSLRGIWNYGFSLPIAVRYAGDAYSARGWLWPVDKGGRPIESKPLVAVARYVGKYINKKTSQDQILKATGERAKWNKTLRNHILSLPKTAFRVRMSRGFGMTVLPMSALSLNALLELTQLSRESTRCPSVLKQNAKRELKSRLAKLPLHALQDAKPQTINLLAVLRDLIRAQPTFNPQSFTNTLTMKLANTAISNETREYIQNAGVQPIPIEKRPTKSFGSK